MSAIISLQNIFVRYEKLEVLKDISFSLNPGMIGLLGPNGAGKSTLIKTLLGLLPISNGQIEILGLPIQQKNFAMIRQKIGYVPEGDCYLKGVSAVHFVAFLAELSGIPSDLALKRAHEVLEYVGLGEERYRKLEELSFGQRSRVKLAQALVHNVELLILDEPTDGMDPVGKENFFNIIKNIQKNLSLSILLATHTLEDVEAICQEIILLYQGKVLAVKNLKDIKQDDQQSYILEISNIPAFIEIAKQNNIEVKEISANKVLVSKIQDPRVLFPLIQNAGVQIWSLDSWHPTLETIFMQILQQNTK